MIVQGNIKKLNPLILNPWRERINVHSSETIKISKQTKKLSSFNPNLGGGGDAGGVGGGG